jgi:carboxymethylenebutenolidase
MARSAGSRLSLGFLKRRHHCVEEEGMRQEIIQLYDEYTHERLGRRVFMDRLTQLAGGTAAAAAVLPVLENNYAKAAMVAADDNRVVTERVSFGNQMEGYLVRPADAAGPLPGVVVIHENRGLNPHIDDVARRVALEGFAALAPDFLSPAGGTPGDEDQAREMIGALDAAATVQNAVHAVAYLQGLDETTDKVGVIGFCWGGGMANQVAVHSPVIAAAVPYYGRQPAAADAAKIKAALLLQYAGLDDRINAGIADYEAALKEAGVDYTIYIYDGANHAFNNDTNEARYNQEAAELAWSRTIAFLHQQLG